MDSFEKCWLTSEKVNWRFQEAFGSLQFDFTKRFLPSRLCGYEQPAWLGPKKLHILNQLRGFSYAHLFLFVEEFIIKLTLNSANKYIHRDNSAFSAMLRFTEEEAKHQRMFTLMKKQLVEGFGFQQAEIANKKEVAQQICSKSPFAVYLLTLVVEFLTQRHYIECFSEEKDLLDPAFVKIFRLHWTEESQHTRIDALELQAIAKRMTESELRA